MNKPSLISPNFLSFYGILSLLSILLYFNTFTHKFALDDKGLIIENRFILVGTTLREIFTTNYRFGADTPDDGLYRPITMLSFVLNRTSTLNPFPYHFTNVILHACSTIIFFILLFSISRNSMLAGISSCIFCIHPLHTEAVANIAGRPELLCTLFLFLSWTVHLLVKRVIISFVLSSFFFFSALLSKETAVVYPFMIIAYDYFIQMKMISKRFIYKYLVLFAILVLYLIIRWIVLGETAQGRIPEFYNNPIYSLPLYERITTALSVCSNYIRLLINPFTLSSDYSFNSLPIYTSLLNAGPLLGLLILVSSVLITIFYGKRYPLYALAIILFLFPYLLISNILFPIGTIMGERLMYLPSAGFSLLIGLIGFLLYKRYRSIAFIIFIGVVLFYSFRTFIRNRDWYDDYTLTKTDIKSYPKNVKLLANMGFLTARSGNYANAEKYYKTSLEIFPKFIEGLTGLGKLMYEQKRFEESLSYYKKAKEIAPDNQQVLFDYASVLINTYQYARAEKELNEAFIRIPNSQLLYRCMGNLKLAMEQYLKAIHYYEISLKLGGNKQFLLNNMALACYYLGDYKRALSYVQAAERQNIQLIPDLVYEIKRRSGILY